MGKEVLGATVYKNPPESFPIAKVKSEHVVLYIATDYQQLFERFDTGVNGCNLGEEQKVLAICEEENTFNKKGKPITLPPKILGIWDQRCSFCKHNPYTGKSEKHCAACRQK